MRKATNLPITANSQKTIIISYIVTALILSTAAIYFIAASQDYVQIFQSASSQNVSASKDALADLIGTTNEMIFFVVVGVAHIPVALWIATRHNSKISYIVAITDVNCVLHRN